MKNRLSRKSSEELAKLTLQDAYLLGFGDGHASASVEGSTIEHEGKLLRKVDRKAREGDYVRPTVDSGSHYIHGNNIYGPVDVFEEIKGKYGISWPVYQKGYNRTTSTVEVFEVVEAIPQIEKSANQQRAELIEKAKKFVEKYTTPNSISTEWRAKGAIAWNGRGVIPKFRINGEKRVVVLELIGAANPKKYGKFYAKCAHGDVFNEWIGKAITLARALKIDIPVEFLEAVQPIDIISGMEIMTYDSFGNEHKSGIVIKLDVRNDSAELKNEKPIGPYAVKSGFTRFVKEHGFKIIDDTNAIYQVGE